MVEEFPSKRLGEGSVNRALPSGGVVGFTRAKILFSSAEKDDVSGPAVFRDKWGLRNEELTTQLKLREALVEASQVQPDGSTRRERQASKRERWGDHSKSYWDVKRQKHEALDKRRKGKSG